MTNHTCRVSGCTRRTKRWSDLCGPHQRVKQRNGHELQRSITKGELTHWKRHVRSLIDARPNAAAIWAKLTTAFEQLKGEAFARSRKTGVHFRWERGGESDLYAACNEAGADAVILTGVALAYLADLDRHRFCSDAAFFCTAGRRLRLMVPEHYGATINAVTGKRHLTARDCSQRQLQHIGTRLMSVFAGPGMALRSAEAMAERRADEARTAATRMITEGSAHA